MQAQLRKGLGRDHGESMTQAGIADMLRGRVCTAGAVNSDTDPDSEGSEDEDRCRPRLRPGLREWHQREIEAMQGRVGRARAAAARQGRERRTGRRRLQKRRKREGGARGGGRVRGCAGARAGRRCGAGAMGGPSPNTNSDEEEAEAEAEAEAEEEEEDGFSDRSRLIIFFLVPACQLENGDRTLSLHG